MIKKIKIALILALIVFAIAFAIWLVGSIKQSEVTIAVDDRINITPEQITSIKAIGEWEFLAIADEELVDTVRKGILSDDHLARIYYGTVRLGINMHQVEPGWITPIGDSLRIILPKIGLLDRDFIDEARTKSFYESGKWLHQDREMLYRKAYRQMLSHSLTPENLRAAQQNGEEQFRRMMKAMGYDKLSVSFSEGAE